MTNKYDNHTIVAACFMIQAVGVGTMGRYGVFSTFWPMIFGWSRATVSGASSLAFFLKGEHKWERLKRTKPWWNL